MNPSPTPSIQYSWDGPGTLGAPDDALYLRWNNATGRFEMASAGVSDHGGLTGLADDDHTIYALLAGRAGGQTLVGGTASGEGLTLTSTSHATKGPITMSGAVRVVVPDGASGAPGVKFASNNVGLYSAAAGVGVVGTFQVSDGSAAVPGLAFAGDTDTGIYRVGSNQIGVVAGGFLLAQFRNSTNTNLFFGADAAQVPITAQGKASQTANLQEWQNSAGTVLASVSSAGNILAASSVFVYSTEYGIQQSGGNTAIFANNQTRATFGNNATFSVPVLVPAGTAAAPGMAFSGDTDTGIYRPAANYLSVICGGSERVRFTDAGIFILAPTVTPLMPEAPTKQALVVKGVASQTANLQEWQDSAATVLTHVKADGRVAIGALTLGATLASGGSFVWRMGGGSDTFAFQNGSSIPYLTLSNTATNQLIAAALTAAKVPLTVDGFASQTANLTEWRNSAGTVLARFTAAGDLRLEHSNSNIYFASTGSAIRLSGGGTLSIIDGSSQTLATFIHNAGGTLRNAGTTRIQWDATGIGFFGVTPVARPTALTAANASALNTGDATSDTVIGNMRTRIGELESKLQALGLLT